MYLSVLTFISLLNRECILCSYDWKNDCLRTHEFSFLCFNTVNHTVTWDSHHLLDNPVDLNYPILCYVYIILYWCNIFELVFTLCHKCNKYNCLPWKMLNHAGNSYITRRKELCHPPETVMSHRNQLYHPLVNLLCMLIRSGSRCNYAVAKQRNTSSVTLFSFKNVK